MEKAEHVVYSENGEVFNAFLNSNWYDTMSPYLYCVSQLKSIKSKIDNNEKFKIESNGKIYHITTNLEFRNWIEKVFYGGFEKHVFID
ncbi:hypothetical protein SAMN05444397_106166 [Flavobacterium aquidurense]|uniref:Uncharacterized protein n=1 Tax=Flavobacterium frigidimaris TaxID=262320 RepID=A0ABX4BS74_FLAFR|nr:hypothetical protein [Flavobacterium frigidimaris]OXA79937.1 hypothetical protein B0A65_08300 [Flavobacterium frigidimaris]SDZ40518.1 hypothetical protein SAMN05444397_106166 [Flavobacterium aquidurense]